MNNDVPTRTDMTSACWTMLFVVGVLGLFLIGFASRLVPDEAARSAFANEDRYSSTAPR